MIFRNGKYLALGLAVFVLIIAAVEPLSENLAHLLLYRSLVDDNILATDRQRTIGYASRLMLLGQEINEEEFGSDLLATGMISLIYRGLYDLRNGRIEESARWLALAAEAPTLLKTQRSLLVSPHVNLDPDGSIVVEGNNPIWRVRSDSSAGASIKPNPAGSSIFFCGSEDSTNDSAVFEWTQPLSLNYHHTLEVNTTVPEGNILIIETVIDGEIARHLSYEGNDRSKQLRIPLVGDDLTYIYILVRGISENTENPSCYAEIYSIRFLKDNLIHKE